MPAITIYTKVYCPFCSFAKALLRKKGLSFEEIDLEDQPHRLPEMVRRAHGAKTVPQIFLDECHIGGSDDLERLNASGQLDAILKTAVPA